MYWVAEIGSTHKGSQALAYEMIRRFSEAGANVIKFQFGWTQEAQEAQGLEYNPMRYVDDWAGQLRAWCNSFNVELMASIWSEEGLKTARMVDMQKYKIGHALKNNPELAGKIYSDKKIVFDSRCEWFNSSTKNIYCVSKYPTYPKDLTDMPKAFSFDYYGYSDHAHGIEACLLAVARGAEYIEKHVCLDKTDLVTRDTPFSATPDEFEAMVRLGNGIRRLINA